jgi:hypothetical protein
MSNRDFSGTTLADQKSNQSQYAAYVQRTTDVAFNNSLQRMSGGAPASLGTFLTVGSTNAGATPLYAPPPVTKTATAYSVSQSILARMRG